MKPNRSSWANALAVAVAVAVAAALRESDADGELDAWPATARRVVLGREVSAADAPGGKPPASSRHVLKYILHMC